MKYRKIIIPFVIVCLLLIMALPSYAADYTYTFKEFVDPDGGPNSLFCDYVTTGGEYESLSHFWYDDNELSLSEFHGSGVQLNLNSDATDYILYGSPGDILLFDFDYFKLVWSNKTAASNITMRVVALFYSDTVQGQKSVTLYEANADRLDLSERAYYWETDQIEYKIDNYYTKLRGIFIEFNFPSYNSVSTSVFAENILFFVGDSSDAPIYSGVDTSTTDDYFAQEDAILSSTEDGRAEVDNIFEQGMNFLTTGSAAVQGLTAVSSLMTLLIGNLELSGVLYISLALGMFAFIVGMAQFVVSRGSKGSKVNKGKGKGG